MTCREKIRQHAVNLKTETIALYLAARHPATPWYARLLAAVVAAYALSPIDLIPDFIPVLGYLDDLVIVPLGLACVRMLIPAHVMAECRRRSRGIVTGKPLISRAAGVAVIMVWLGLALWSGVVLYRMFVIGSERP